MQELINSMIRLSAAVTIFGVQQVQTVVTSADPKPSFDKIREVIDAMANAASSKIDDSSRAAVDRFSNLPQDMLKRTWDSTKEVMENTSDMVKAASDVLMTATRPAGEPNQSEPKLAEEALAGH
jgi:hypothetical protein